MQDNSTDRLLTPEQAAELLQVSKRTMYEWLRNGEIPSVRMGERLIRVREKDVLTPDVRAFLEEGLKYAHSPHTVEQAATAFEKAIKMNPRYTLAYFHLGTMFYEWSHFDRAVEPLKKAIELNPEAFPAYMNLGMNYNHAGQHAEAEKILMKAVELNPNHAEAYYQLGFSVIQQFGREKEAAIYFSKAVEIDPKHGMATHFCGWALVRAEDFNGAREFKEQIKDSHPEEAEHLKMLIELNERPKRRR
jgi:excisionase family DNA binding protein